MATVSENGWPYIQHRGGPAGFLKMLDTKTLAFADFRGNRQHISVGNIAHDDRVSLFLMDYPRQARLKILGRMQAVDLADKPELAASLATPGHKAKISVRWLSRSRRSTGTAHSTSRSASRWLR